MDPLKLPPLSTLDHPVVRHMASVFDGADGSTAQRESITGLKNPMWYKLKTGRWRGAVFVDDDGQAWLCAAGLRRERESSDFYAHFMSEVLAKGPEQYLPSTDDRRRLRLESVEQRLDGWERTVHRAASEALTAAQVAGVSAFDVAGLSAEDAPISAVEVRVVVFRDGESANDNVAEIVVTVVHRDRAATNLADRADLIVLAAIDPEEQAWDVTAGVNGLTYSLVMSEAELVALVGAVDAERVPGETTAGTVAHYAHRERLTEYSIEGRAVHALCGTWFVPRQDHESLECCKACEAIYGILPT